MLFLPGRIAGSLLVLYGPGMLVGEPGVLFCHVECLETRGQSLEDALYLCAWDEPCSCSISCGRINSVCRITWSCWIACGNTVVLVEWMDCVWKHCTRRLEYLSLDIFSLLFFGNNSVHRIIVLVSITGCMQNACGFDHMFSLLKRCKYSLYSDTMLNYWSTNHC